MGPVINQSLCSQLLLDAGQEACSARAVVGRSDSEYCLAGLGAV